MKNINIIRILSFIIAGAICGIAIFLIFNPSLVREEMGGGFQKDFFAEIQNIILSSILLGGSFGAMLGGLLLLADEITSPPKRIAIRVFSAAVTGGFIGAIGGFVAQFLFSIAGAFARIAALGGAGMFMVALSLGRGIAWAVLGAGAGIGIGWTLGSWQRAKMSLMGAMIGGFIGGLLFDAIAQATNGGSASRFFGFTVMGAVTGAAVALVEDIVKQSWVTVLSGPKEGRSYILTKPVTTIGRDELADIPLFGDSSIAKQHAQLILNGGSVSIRSLAGVPLSVNGSLTTDAQLKDWDVFTLGRFSLRLHQKGTSAAVVQPVSNVKQRWFDPSQQNLQVPQPEYISSNQTIMHPDAVKCAGNLILCAISGPHQNQRFQFGPGIVKIGREIGSSVFLPQDSLISRNHAEITWDGANWSIKDLNSTNGLYLNGARISQQIIKSGDQIGVGQTWLKVESV